MNPFSRLAGLWRHPPVYFAVLTALALATPLAFAPYYRFWLMPLLFAALLHLFETKPQRRILSAYWFGFAGYAAQFWWVHTSMHDIGGLPNLYAVPFTLLFPAFLALFPAIALWLYGKYRLPRLAGTGIALPVLWTLCEFARERVMTGFGWGALGYSQIADGSPLAGYAPLGGIHLVTLAAACCGAWLLLAVHARSLKGRILPAAALALLLYGGHALRGTAFTRPAGAPVSVALVQGNIAQRMKFSPEHYLETYQRYYDLVSRTRARIVILPETAFPQFLQDLEPGLLEQFADTAAHNGSALALGIPVYAEDGKNYLNAAANLASFDPEQPDRLQIYAKNHLVPFGEYKPLPALTGVLYSAMNMPLADFKRGGTGQMPFDMAGQKVAFNICYEDGFGDELIASARTSTMLANISNMAWFGRSAAKWQQLQQSQTRALELGRPMLRATNTGATAVVSPQGSILALAAPDTVAVLEAEVQGMQGSTPYMRTGSSWPLVCALAALAVLLLFCRPRRPRPAADSLKKSAPPSDPPEPETAEAAEKTETAPAAEKQAVRPARPYCDRRLKW